MGNSFLGRPPVPVGVAAVFFALAVSAMPGASQTIRGRVLDEATELPIPGVYLELIGFDGEAVSSRIADDEAGFLFTNLAPGDYVVKVTAPLGFVTTVGGGDPDDDDNTDSNGVPVSSAGSTVRSGETTIRELSLEPAI